MHYNGFARGFIIMLFLAAHCMQAADDATRKCLAELPKIASNALLLNAYTRNDSEGMRFALAECNADPNLALDECELSSHKFYNIPLVAHASLRGNIEAMRILCAAGADANQLFEGDISCCDSPRRPITPLWATALCGDASACALLLAAGADSNFTTKNGAGMNVFEVAECYHNTPAVAVLLHTGKEFKIVKECVQAVVTPSERYDHFTILRLAKFVQADFVGKCWRTPLEELDWEISEREADLASQQKLLQEHRATAENKHVAIAERFCAHMEQLKKVRAILAHDLTHQEHSDCAQMLDDARRVSEKERKLLAAKCVEMGNKVKITVPADASGLGLGGAPTEDGWELV